MKSPKSKIDPTYLSIKEDGFQFVLTFKDEPIRTASGKAEVRHSARDLLAQMISEFDGRGKIVIEEGRVTAPIFFGAYNSFSIQKDIIETGQDPIDKEDGFVQLLLDDPTLRFQAGPEGAEQLSRYGCLFDWLGAARMKALFPESLKYARYGGDFEVMAQEEGAPPKDFHETVAFLRSQYRAATPAQRATVMALILIHEAVFLYPLALALGHCTPAAYAQGVLTSHYGMAGIFSDTSEKRQRKQIDALRADASTALDYIVIHDRGTPEQRVRAIIDKGENATVEFKSTLRYNLRSNQHDPATITHACLKTVAAFLNTEGGTLLIGVDDDGACVGIEKDGFPNTDKFLLHLTDKIKHALGEIAASLVTPEVLPYQGGTVCVVACRRSDKPIYCKGAGKDTGEQFYVRTGPSTTAMPMSSAHDYISSHFSKRG